MSGAIYLYVFFILFTEAINVDRMDIALCLMNAKCDVNLKDRLKQAPIHSAVSKGR